MVVDVGLRRMRLDERPAVEGGWRMLRTLVLAVKTASSWSREIDDIG